MKEIFAVVACVFVSGFVVAPLCGDLRDMVIDDWKAARQAEKTQAEYKIQVEENAREFEELRNSPQVAHATSEH